MRDKPNKLQEAQKHVSDVIKKIQDDKEKKEKPKNIGKLSDAMKEIASRIDKLFTSFKHCNGAVGDLAGIANTIRKLKREGTDTSHSDRMHAASGKNKKTLMKAKALADDIIKLVGEHNPSPTDGSNPVDNVNAVEEKAKQLGGILKQIQEMANGAKNDSSKKRRLELLAEDVDEIIQYVVDEVSGKEGFGNIDVLIRTAKTEEAPKDTEESAEEDTAEESAEETPTTGTAGTATGTDTTGTPAPQSVPKTPKTNSGTDEIGDILDSATASDLGMRGQYYIPDTPYYRNYW